MTLEHRPILVDFLASITALIDLTPESDRSAHRSRGYNVRHERWSAIFMITRYFCGLWRNYPILNN